MLANQVPAINKLFLLASVAPQLQSTNTAPITQIVTESPIRNQVVAAIAQLGYSNVNIRKIIDEVLATNSNISVEDAIKEVLKKI